MQTLLKAVRDMFKEWKFHGVEGLESLKQQHLQSRELLQRLSLQREERRQQQEEVLIGQMRQTARIVRQQQQQQLDLENQMKEQIFRALENMKLQEVNAVQTFEKGAQEVSKQKIQEFKERVKQILQDSRAKVKKQQKEAHENIQRNSYDENQQSMGRDKNLNSNQTQTKVTDLSSTSYLPKQSSEKQNE
eukprot:TRINITY_DN29088_c0_g1_i1.p2 TRINITY_DN29088_c0_g1~~TRINITY_DN29088_c0_g1_i1.p2  ORF type:complete len:201 (+),score=15.36 TRINITY_DN29088_c0_g1_i1:36-605(+)